jgi:hypothetical protein
MAKFDYVRSEIPLPDGWTGELHTCAFGSGLSIMLIRGDGRLLAQEFEHRDIATAQRPQPDWNDASTPPSGAVRSTTPQWRDLAFDGEFEFHRPAAPGSADHRYVARFVQGQLTSIAQKA